MAKVMVVGGGGREHVLAKRLARSPLVEKVYCAPGNAGTAEVGENVHLSVGDLAGLAKFAKEHAIDLTVVGPEAPLCAGIVDEFERLGLRIFGPRAAAARIEGDKAWAKHLMKVAKVPTAEARIFDKHESAREYVATRDTGVVVKASGLAAGKGVFVCEEASDGLLALETIMIDQAFGDSGATVIVEELLRGEELSVFALVDDRTIYVLESSQDHKRLGDGDAGPNTGGMGAYSPAPIATDEVLQTVEEQVLVPIVDALRGEDAAYNGLLYVGLMLTPAGPKVLEFNCRFGDPEAQVVLPRMKTDLYEVLSACAGGTLEDVSIEWDPRAAVCVVMAAGGYPESPERGKKIGGLAAAASIPDVEVFHAGTRRLGGDVLTAGGRVLAVTGLGATVSAAQKKAYEGIEAIHFDGAHYRRDIAARAMKAHA